MRHKTSLELFAYWNRRRGERAEPSRLDIEPADIRALLPDIFILQAEAGGDFEFRLAGTGICGLFDRELKGETLGRLWLPDGVETVIGLAADVLAGSSPGIVEIWAESRAGRSVEMELLLLPLSDGSKGNQRILGSLCPLDRPYWLTVDPIVSLVTASIRVLDVHKEHVFLASRPRIPVEPNMSIFRSSGASTDFRRINHLTLIEGGRA